MERVSLNGVKVYPFTSTDELLAYVSQRKGILVAINAEKILQCDYQSEYWLLRRDRGGDGDAEAWLYERGEDSRL